MTPPNSALNRVVQAAERVENAAGEWNAVDLTVIGKCVSALEASAGDLSAALTILPGSDLKGYQATRSSLRANLLNLKESVGRLERLVDASAAFLRSAPGLACGQPVLYQADGVICQVAAVSEMGGMQG
jgi:hypothetical protein